MEIEYNENSHFAFKITFKCINIITVLCYILRVQKYTVCNAYKCMLLNSMNEWEWLHMHDSLPNISFIYADLRYWLSKWNKEDMYFAYKNLDKIYYYRFIIFIMRHLFLVFVW